MKLQGVDDENVMQHLAQHSDKYTCHQVQNEIIRSMALTVLRKLATDFHTSVYYSLMADKVTDSSNRVEWMMILRHMKNS